MKTIKINCPCGENLLVEINEDFRVISVKFNEIEISESEQIEIMKKLGIEFG